MHSDTVPVESDFAQFPPSLSLYFLFLFPLQMGILDILCEQAFLRNV